VPQVMPYFHGFLGEGICPRDSRTLQFSGKTFLLFCTSHVASGSRLVSNFIKHNRSGSFGIVLTVMMVCSILLDLAIIPNARSF